MTSPSCERVPHLLQPRYRTRSQYMENAINDCGGILSCQQDGKLEETHSRSVNINDLRSCLQANRINMVSGANNIDDLQEIQKSHPFICKYRGTDLQSTRKSPRLSSFQSKMDIHMSECNQEGVECRTNSLVDGVDKNLIFRNDDISYGPQQSQNRSEEIDLGNARKSVRLSRKSRETDSPCLSDSGEKVVECREESQKTNLNREKLHIPSEVKVHNKVQIHNKTSNGVGERAVKNSQTLPMVSIVDYCKKGDCGDESHIERSRKSNLFSNNNTLPASLPHILNAGVICDEVIDLQSTRKSVGLSGNREMDMQKKDPTRADVSFANNMAWATVSVVQNMRSQSNQETDLRRVRKSLRLSGMNRESNLDSNTSCTEEVINSRTEYQEKGSNILCPVELVDMSQGHNGCANSVVQMDVKNIRKSPRLSAMKRQLNLESCSQKTVNLGVASQKRGHNGNNISLPIEVNSTSVCPSRPVYAQAVAKSDENEINLGAKSDSEGFDGSIMSLPIELELTSEPSWQDKFAKADENLLEKASISPLNPSKSIAPFVYYVSSEKGINLIVDLNSSPAEWINKKTLSSVETLHQKKFDSFRQEIESLRSKKIISSFAYAPNTFNNSSPNHLQYDALPKSVSLECCPLQSYLPERGNGSSDITETSSCIASTGDGHPDNSSKVNVETAGDYRSSSEELLGTGISDSGTKAPNHSHGLMNTEPEVSRKRKRRGREIHGILLKSGKRLGSRKSMRLRYKVYLLHFPPR